ncbi:hypothetical protein [Desulfosarcina ovata]|uniref:Uncharacterized protein n=1 Tax=Desulfosarcina ovata subsp. ovata TaxID=2752305 RepID=A0A5K8AAN1_9BACT|nr:hypothetical protein [Desulfosarcina ovata]BBO89538.1 hypothetical protein DSCOOX_27180 [Desulfosarcina ovata subsp. ovata]
MVLIANASHLAMAKGKMVDGKLTGPGNTFPSVRMTAYNTVFSGTANVEVQLQRHVAKGKLDLRHPAGRLPTDDQIEPGPQIKATEAILIISLPLKICLPRSFYGALPVGLLFKIDSYLH